MNEDFAAAVQTVLAAAHVMPDPSCTEEALDLLRACRFAKDRLAILEREAVNFLGDVLPNGTQEIEGYGGVTHRRTVQFTAWQHEAIRPKVVRQIAMDEQAQGDIDLVERIISRWQQFTGTPSRYSLPALKAIGIEPDEVASAQWRSTITVEKDR